MTTSTTGVPELAPHLVAVLKFAARHEGMTDAALEPLVRQAFGLSVLRYRQRLYAAVIAPGAEAVEPAVVRRLRGAVVRRRARLRPGTIPTPRGA